MRPHLILALFVILPVWTGIQAQGNLLDAYVREALEESPFLEQQALTLEKSQVALKEARGYYLPELGFGATYSLAAGGRTISIPIGDLLNPV